MEPSTGHNQSIKRRRARLDWPSGVSNVCRDRTEIRVLMTFMLLGALHGAELLDFRAPQEFIKTNKKFSGRDAFAQPFFRLDFRERIETEPGTVRLSVSMFI
jgi:hypothetical protein